MKIVVDKMRIFVDVDLPGSNRGEVSFYPSFLSMAIHSLDLTLDSSMDAEAASTEIASLDLGPDSRAVSEQTRGKMARREKSAEAKMDESSSSSSSSFESSSDSDSDGDAFSFSSTGSSEEVDEADDAGTSDRDLPQSETKGTSQQHHNHHDVRMAFHHETPFTPLREKQEKARRKRQRSNMGRGYGDDSEDDDSQTDSDVHSEGSHTDEPLSEGTPRQRHRHKRHKGTACRPL